ncbi:MAG: CBS domain-containing protein [Candidatus Hodarchaeales archaeon]|jgi:CBS domain-containing protein/ribosome-associated translation inhibitor RaiA
MKVKQIMLKKFPCLSPEDTVSKFISLMERGNREVIICDKRTLKGIIKYRDLTEKTVLDPTKTKLGNIMDFPPPHLEPNQDVDDAADVLFKSNLRILPVCEKDKVIGLFSIIEVIKLASRSKSFRQTKAEQIMSLPEVITPDTDIGKARVLVREKNISRLPVIDNNKLIGIVTVFDLGKSLKPRERMSWYSMGAEKERVMGMPVSTVMNSRPLMGDRNDSLTEISNLMLKRNIDGVVITDDRTPVGIVAAKDLLEFYVSGFQQKGIYYQTIGLVDEDDFVIDTVDRMIRDTVQKLAYVFKPKFFLLHVKRYNVGGKIKYSVRTRYNANKGTFISKAYAWDLRDAVDEALGRLERMVLRKKKTIRDRVSGNVRKIKRMLK